MAADVTTAPDEVLVAMFAAEWALAESGVALTAGGVEVDDDVTQAFGDASRAGARIWLDAHPGPLPCRPGADLAGRAT